MPRPLFAYSRYVRHYEFEGNYARTITEWRGSQYFASEAGARAAARRAGEEWDDYECYGQVEKLQPGKVYDHVANKWVDGLAYQPWYGEAWAAKAVEPLDDEIPF